MYLHSKNEHEIHESGITARDDWGIPLRRNAKSRVENGDEYFELQVILKKRLLTKYFIQDNNSLSENMYDIKNKNHKKTPKCLCACNLLTNLPNWHTSANVTIFI